MMRNDKDDGVPVVYDPVEPVYSNTFKIGITGTDIGLDFGNCRKEGNVEVAFVQVPLPTAKALAAALALAVAEYEKKYGPVPVLNEAVLDPDKPSPTGMKPFKSKGGVQ